MGSTQWTNMLQHWTIQVQVFTFKVDQLRQILRKREEIYEVLRLADLADITKMTGCKKPCSYLKYQFLRQEPSILQSEHYAFSLWAVSNKTTIRTEQLIYPLTSLVAEFGGTLGLFLGISFITLWDNMTYLKQMCKVVSNIYWFFI